MSNKLRKQDCARARGQKHRDKRRDMANARPQPPVPPATWGRVTVNRKNGVDRKAQS